MVGGAGSANAMRAIQADNTVLKATVTYPPTMAGSAVALARLIAQGRGMGDLVEQEVPASITLALGHGDQGQRRRSTCRWASSPDELARSCSASGWSATPSWARPTPRPGGRPGGSSTCRCSRTWPCCAAATRRRRAAAAEKLGWRSVETDWRALLARDDVAARRRLLARRHARRDRDRGAGRRQARAVREAAGEHRRRGAGDGRGGRARGGRGRAQHGRLQLPAGAGGGAGAAAGRAGPDRRDPARAGAVPAGLDRRPRVPAGVAAAAETRRGRGRSATSARTSSTWRST